MYVQSIEEIKAFTLRQKPFFCENIKVVLKENDELMRQINENEASYRQREADYIKAEGKKRDA